MSLTRSNNGHKTTGIIFKFPLRIGIPHKIIKIISFIIKTTNPYSLLLAVRYVAIMLATTLIVLTNKLLVLNVFNTK